MLSCRNFKQSAQDGISSSLVNFTAYIYLEVLTVNYMKRV